MIKVAEDEQCCSVRGRGSVTRAGCVRSPTNTTTRCSAAISSRIPGGWVLRSLADGLLAMPVAERGGDLRASQKIVNLPAVLVVIGGQQVEHIVTVLTAQHGEQGSQPGRVRSRRPSRRR